MREQFEDPRAKAQIGPGVREEDVHHLVESFFCSMCMSKTRYSIQTI